MGDVRINPAVSIPEEEIELSFARAGGPGGQKVNTSSTKVELRWSLEDSDALIGDLKDQLRSRIGNRLTKDGVLVLHASEYRTQGRNRQAVLGRFRNLLADALEPEKERKATRPTRASEERRLRSKRERSRKKELRQDPGIPPES